MPCGWWRCRIVQSCHHRTDSGLSPYVTPCDWASVFDCVTALCFFQWWSLCDHSVFLPLVVPFTSFSVGSADMLALHQCCIFSSSGTQVDCIIGIHISLLMYAATVVFWVWQKWLFFRWGLKGPPMPHENRLHHTETYCTIWKHTAPYENRLHHTET